MSINQLLASQNHVFIKQIKEWGEIITNFETKNKYQLLDESGKQIAYIYETGSGFMHFIKRMIFRSHRAFTIDIVDDQKQLLMRLDRPFFWFFSDLTILDPQGKVLGQVFRRFGFFSKKYDLVDANGRTFAKISAGIFKIWTFNILDQMENHIATISKKWGGILKEMFTDADQFGVEFKQVSDELRPVVLGCAISIDFDFFDDNHKN